MNNINNNDEPKGLLLSSFSFLAVESIEINCTTASLSSRSRVHGILGISKAQQSSSSLSFVLTVVAALSPSSSSSSSSSNNTIVTCWQETFSMHQLEEQLKLMKSNETSSSSSSREQQVFQRMKAYLNIITSDDNRSSKNSGDNNTDNNDNNNDEQHKIKTEWRLEECDNSNRSSNQSSSSLSSSSILKILVTQKNPGPAGLTRKLWTPILTSLSSSTSTSPASLCCFSLTTHLLQTLQDEQNKTLALQNQLVVMTSAQEARRECKQLLQKTNTWDMEKTKLLQNFCKLTQAKDECLIQYQTQIKQLQNQLAQHQELIQLAKDETNTVKEQLAAAVAGAAGTGSTTALGGNHKIKLDPCFEACPNDANELYGDDYIAQLARGLPDPVISSEMNNSNNKKKRSSSSAATTTVNSDVAAADDDAMLPHQKKRVNAATGNIEYFGAEAAIQDLEQMDIEQQLQQEQDDKKKKNHHDSTTATTTTSKKNNQAASSSPPSIKNEDNDDDDATDDDDMNVELEQKLLPAAAFSSSSSSIVHHPPPLERDTI